MELGLTHGGGGTRLAAWEFWEEVREIADNLISSSVDPHLPLSEIGSIIILFVAAGCSDCSDDLESGSLYTVTSRGGLKALLEEKMAHEVGVKEAKILLQLLLC